MISIVCRIFFSSTQDINTNPCCSKQISQYFLKKHQVTGTKITEIQIFSKAIWAFWIGRQIWKGHFKVYYIFNNGRPIQTFIVLWWIFPVWEKVSLRYNIFLFHQIDKTFRYGICGKLKSYRGWFRNLKTGVQVFGPVKQKPVVGGNRKGHVDPLPYPAPLGHQNIGQIDTT